MRDFAKNKDCLRRQKIGVKKTPKFNEEASAQRAMKRAKAGGWFTIVSVGIGLLLATAVFYGLPYAMAIAKVLTEQ